MNRLSNFDLCAVESISTGSGRRADSNVDGQGADEQLAGYTPFYPRSGPIALRKGHFLRFTKEINAFHKKGSGSGRHTVKMVGIAFAYLLFAAEDAGIECKKRALSRKRTAAA